MLLIAIGASLTLQACKPAVPSEPSGSVAARSGSIHWTPDLSGSNKLLVEVHDLDAASLERLRESARTPTDWQNVLSVYAGRAGSTSDTSLPPMMGAYRVESNVLLFESHFPVEPGTEYRAVFRPPALGSQAGEAVTSIYLSPAPNGSPATVVSHIYPSADELPENLLKFYVQFSAPMSRGRIYDHIHLRDSSGKEVELPFLEIDEELWDPAMTRLTLIIDPGRIKRGVRPLQEIGPVFEAGKGYTLTIDSAWKDGSGVPLKQPFEKTFKAGSSDREPVDPTHWRFQPPPSGTLEPLSIVFPEPMDNAVTRNSLRVTSDSGDSVEGKSGLEDQERRWTFVPANPWRSGAYKFVIQTTIEDLAGNNIGKPFDVDKRVAIRKRPESSTMTLPFEIR